MAMTPQQHRNSKMRGAEASLGSLRWAALAPTSPSPAPRVAASKCQGTTPPCRCKAPSMAGQGPWVPGRKEGGRALPLGSQGPACSGARRRASTLPVTAAPNLHVSLNQGSHPGLARWVLTPGTRILIRGERETEAPAGVAQWIEHQPANQRVTGSIPSQGTFLGSRPDPQ